jgi:uncharacterized protein YjbJ (UPF0337 family)
MPVLGRYQRDKEFPKMTDDRIAGTAKNIGGKVQEAYGETTGNASAQARGKLRQAEGNAQDLYGQAKETVADAARIAQGTAEDAADVVREFVEKRPYTTAFAMLAMGYLIGRMGRY